MFARQHIMSLPFIICRVMGVYDLPILSTGLARPDGEGIGVGLDSCVMPTRHKGIFLVQTTDLYPLRFVLSLCVGTSVCVCVSWCVCLGVCLCVCVHAGCVLCVYIHVSVCMPVRLKTLSSSMLVGFCFVSLIMVSLSASIHLWRTLTCR